MLKTLLAASIVSLSAPLPQDPLPPIQEETPTPPVDKARPQSARQALLFVYDVFDELRLRHDDLAFTGLWPPSRYGEEREVELPDTFGAGRAFDRLGPASVEIVEAHAIYQASKSTAKDRVVLQVELRVRAEDVVKASLAYDFVCVALASQDEVLSVAPAKTLDLAGGGGIHVPSLRIELDLDGRATRPRATRGQDASVETQVRVAANRDNIDLGRLAITPHEKRTKGGWVDSIWRVRPDPRDQPFDFIQVYNFAYVLERDIPDAVITELAIAPAKKTGRYELDLSLTRRRRGN